MELQKVVDNPLFFRQYLDSLVKARGDVVDDIDSSGGEGDADISTQEFQAVTKRLEEITNAFIAQFGEAQGVHLLEQVYKTGSIEAGQPRKPSPPHDRAVTPQLPVGLEPHPYFDEMETSRTRKRKRSKPEPIRHMIGIYRGGQRKMGSDGTRQTTLFPRTLTDRVRSLQALHSHLSSKSDAGMGAN